MRKEIVLSFYVFSMVVLLLVSGCGSGNKEAGPALTQTNLVNAIHLGDLNCLQCHNAGKDLTMNNDLDTRTIGAVWQNSLHNGDLNGIRTVHCEDCHGGGEFHWGVGPLAHPVPFADVCLQCHGENNPSATPVDGLSDMQSFLGTGHANGNNKPDGNYSQIATPVNLAQHIEECSVCHNSNQRFVIDSTGNLLKPDPNNLPTPQVACASCHDAHQVGLTANLPLPRVDGSTNVDYRILRKVQVNANGANDANAGAWIRPIIFWNHSTMGQTTRIGDSPVLTPLPGGPLDANGKRELTVEQLCASCHTVGTYKNSGGATHQPDTYSQWKNSAHGTRSDAPWAEFSADPQAYNPAFKNLSSHTTTYPFDMSKKTGNLGGNNYACFKCHNGLGSIDWQDNVQGTAAASVLWGDEPATCITCHDPHANVPGQSKNTRKPVVMTNYSTAFVKILGNVFLDTQPVPGTTGNSTICIFCHQGRESGFTLYKTKLAPGTTITGAFFNPHYLGTAAMLWGANGYEYAGQMYGVNAAHQGANCATCHMNNPTPDNLAGGHTWVRNVNTCNVSTCHGGFGPVPAFAGTVFPNISSYRAPFDTTNYTGDANGATQGIPQAVRSLQQKLITLLQGNGIFYNDLKYPYFFANPTFTTSFTAWTPPTLKAAFNLSFIVKGLPSGATSQANVPNGSAAVHDHIYNIQLLIDSYTDLFNNSAAAVQAANPSPTTLTRPAGSRPATVYGPGQ